MLFTISENNNNEIRIHTYMFSKQMCIKKKKNLPLVSFLFIEIIVEDIAKVKFCNNGFLSFFQQIRLEIQVVEVDNVLGITSAL